MSAPRIRARWVAHFLAPPMAMDGARRISLTAQLAEKGFTPRRHPCPGGGAVTIWHPPGAEPRPDWSAIHVDADERDPFDFGPRRTGDQVDAIHERHSIAAINLAGMAAGLLIACVMAFSGLWS